MKKMLFAGSVLILLLTLSGCGEQYPEVRVVSGEYANRIDISIGSPYVYKGFDLETNDGGKDLTLHFVEGE